MTGKTERCHEMHKAPQWQPPGDRANRDETCTIGEPLIGREGMIGS
jgi:hypothetical protein